MAFWTSISKKGYSGIEGYTSGHFHFHGHFLIFELVVPSASKQEEESHPVDDVTGSGTAGIRRRVIMV